MNAALPRISVFAKAPVPGQAKTRLIPALGPDGAARLHARLVTHTLTTVSAAALGPVTLWCAPDTAHPFFDGLAARFGVTREVQRGRASDTARPPAPDRHRLPGAGGGNASDCGARAHE